MQLVRLAFWILYNPLAWAYDWVSKVVSLGRWRDWQRAALPELHGDRVLELAFGTGNMLEDLHAAQHQAIGLELSPFMIDRARRKLQRSGVSVPLVQGRAQRLPFAGAAFDAILATFPAEFIVAPDTLSEVSRVLRPGGRMVVVAMAQFIPDSLWARLLEWLYRITGQRGPLPDLQPYLDILGLEHHTIWRSVQGTSVLLVVLEKHVAL